jgi:glycosyltransferase involved in cell wall biosynthesis
MPPPRVSITIPVYNEEKVLANSVRTIAAFLNAHNLTDHEIVIANNASSDATHKTALRLAEEIPNLRVLHLDQKGRGRAIRAVWTQSASSVLLYMDVDLSTDLAHLPPLIQSIESGAHDVAIGSRLLDPHLTKRGFKRDTISRCYNLLVKACFRTRFSDAQCGFKAISNAAARALLPLVENNEWFFDTELLVLAEKLGFKIFDLPVRWTDDPDSRVKILPTALEDLRGLWRLRRNLPGIVRRNHRSGFVLAPDALNL